MEEYLKPALLFLGTLGSAYLGAYVAEKGKALAIHEGLQRVHRATRELEAAVSGQLWLSQERWRLKSTTYQELLKLLAAQSSSARSFAAFWQDHANVPAAAWSSEVASENQRLMDEVTEIRRRFREARAVAQLWLGKDTVDVLSELQHRMNETAAAPDPHSAVFADLEKLTWSAVTKIVDASRSDLDLGPPPAQAAAAPAQTGS